MNKLQIFNNPKFGNIRTITENGKTLFCGSDVAKALGYKNPSKALSDHCKGVTKRYTPTSSGQQEMNFIPEGDIYRLAAKSELPGAEEFESWIFDEVLPTIRKTGSYTVQPMSPAQLIAAQAQILVEMEKRMDEMQGQAKALEAKVDTAIKAFARPAEDHWKSDMDKAIKELCADIQWSLPKLQGKLYAELEEKANCNINARLSALRKRKKKNGMRYRDAQALTKLDAIAADKQLRAIFESIVRAEQARAVPSREGEVV